MPRALRYFDVRNRFLGCRTDIALARPRFDDSLAYRFGPISDRGFRQHNRHLVAVVATLVGVPPHLKSCPEFHGNTLAAKCPAKFPGG